MISKREDGSMTIEEAIVELRHWGVSESDIEDILSLDIRDGLNQTGNPKRFRSSGRKGDA